MSSTTPITTERSRGRSTGRDLVSEVAFLTRELKTPVINETFSVLGDQARDEGWSHEEYLAAVLGRQVASRTANGTRMRIAAAHFPRGQDHRGLLLRPHPRGHP